MLMVHGLSKPYTSSDKSLPRRQAAAEEGLSTPTRQHSFPDLPTLLEAELLIKHHLPGSVEADWGWPGAKEKLPKYSGKKNPPYRPQFPPPGSSWSCFYFIRVGNLSHGVPQSTRKPTFEDQVISSPTLCRKRLGCCSPPPTHSRALTRTHNPSQRRVGCGCVFERAGYSSFGNLNLAFLL